MKKLMLTMAMMVALTMCAVTSIALADDIKTVNGKEYERDSESHRA